MEPDLFWGLFAVTGEALAFMLFRSAEEEWEEQRRQREERS